MPALHTATGVLHPLRVTVPRRRGTTVRPQAFLPQEHLHREGSLAGSQWVSLARASAFAGISRLPARFDFQAL